jgi:formate hydrogenlyase subunit 7
VAAAGVWALGGGCFAGGPMTHGPLDRLLPVDVYIPGCPPSPLALLHGLLLAVGRAEERLRVSG